MIRIKYWAALGGAAIAISSFAGQALAQQDGGGGPPGGFGGGPGGPGGPGGFGNFDPAQMQQMMADMQQQMSDAQKEQLEVTDDAEWKIIQAAIQKVTDARAQLNTGGGGMGMFGMMGGRRGGQGGPGGFGGGPGGPGGPGGMTFPGMPTPQPNPAADALQKAIDDKASPDELKAAVAKFLDARKQRQGALDKAQADLRKLLSVRQEAIAYTMGLL